MPDNIPAAKRELRRRIRDLLARQSPVDRNTGSQAACARLIQQPVWHSARQILSYAPLPEEVDVWPLAHQALADGKLLCLPRFDPMHGVYHAACVQHLTRDIQSGHRGIREPAQHCATIPINQLDLLLVPGVAYGLKGERIGRGKGYYDRLLKHTPGTKCGIGFDFQIQDDIPMAPEDVYLDCILTPTRWCVANQRLAL